MEQIPTAEELFEKYSTYYSFEEGDPECLIDEECFKKALIEFSELHVKAALEAAADTAELKDYDEYQYGGGYITKQEIDEKSILNAYPLTKLI